MPDPKITSNDMGEKEIAEDYDNNDSNNTSAHETARELASRKERRKAAKKEKRKKKRKEMAETARRDDEARLNDPEEQLRLQAEEEQEKARVERELREFEERERKILEEWERKRADDEREEEERSRRAREEEQLKQNQVGYADEVDEDGWEYVEEGPPEIIWQGNEIIVKKKKIRVKKADADQQITKEDPYRPTSNPLPPESDSIADCKNTSFLSAQQLLENVAQETPNFGTEQDKAHCPFHLKTGACRFGSRCSRIHFYPDKSCTLLIKNMYNGPGLAWEQDEGLEHTDEEVKHAYEEFYDDVHTEFLKFGEIVNFKVSRNGSSHLRGNMYVHYKSLDSAVLAYQSVNGRYFAGKQVQCEFVGVTKWKVAICGEFMKSRFQACSRGTACNFIHCFRNPGGDYEWADWDKPAPKYWLKKMEALFGSPDKSGCERHIERESSRPFRKSSRTSTDDVDRYHYRRSRSKEIDYSKSSRHHSEDDSRQRRHTTADRKHPEVLNYTSSPREKKSHRKNVKLESRCGKNNRISIQEFGSDEFMYHSSREDYGGNRHSSRGRRHKEMSNEILDEGCDEDHRKDVFESGTSTSAAQHNKASTSPGDADGDKNISSKYLEDKISFRQRNHNRSKHTSSRDRASRRNGEVEEVRDSENSRNYDRSYGTSDSSSRSGKDDSGKIGCGESEREFYDLKKSKRKRDIDERGVSESRIDCRKVKMSHAIHVRDRWEPDRSDSSEQEEFD